MFDFLWILPLLMSHLNAWKEGPEGRGRYCSACVCTKDSHCDGMVANCTRRGLQSVPSDLPPSTSCLYLDHNNISSVQSASWNHLKSLKVLDMSNNTITEIKGTSFMNLHSLQILKLNDNRISFDQLHVSSDLFGSLQQLQKLEIQNNNNTKTFNDDIFKAMVSLKELSMDGLLNGTYGKGFANLKSLQMLILYGNVEYVDNDTFTVFQNVPLTELYFRGGKLSNLIAMAFAHFTNLTTLSLDYNPLLTFKNAARSWYGLQFTNISTLSLVYCNPVYLDIPTKIDRSFFEYLNLTEIKHLNLDRNHISEITEFVFHKYLPHLETLSLSYNRIETYWLCFWFDIYLLRSLTSLSITHQLRHVREMPQAARVNQQGACEGTDWNFPGGFTFFNTALMPANLQSVSLDSFLSTERGRVNTFTLLGAKHLHWMDLSGNGMRHIHGPVILQFPLQWVRFNFQRNSMVYFSCDAFAEFIQQGTRVEAMDFFDNSLGAMLNEDENGRTFNACSDIEYLSLGLNEIKGLPEKVFINLTKMKTLNLTGNSLRAINFTFGQMRFLRTIDLSFNLISKLSKDVIFGLEKLIANRNESLKLKIDLTGNAITCSCENLDFLIWIKKTQVQIYNYESYICTLHDEYPTLKEVYEKHINNLIIRCKGREYVKAVASVCTVLVVTVVISVFLYRHRWDIRYLLLQLLIKGRKYYDLRNNENEDRYIYDAFVCYHDDDKGWIETELLPMLEGVDDHNTRHQVEAQLHSRLRLCVHFRDFDPGTRISENIAKAMENSHKIILLLSQSFLQSSWCEMETHFAFSKCFFEGRNCIVPIKLNDFDVEQMRGELRIFKSKYSYLEWGKYQNDEPVFWKKLRSAIKNDRDTPLPKEY